MSRVKKIPHGKRYREIFKIIRKYPRYWKPLEERLSKVFGKKKVLSHE